MSLFEDTNPRALKDLLAEVHGGTMVLPDFQRDFVWEPGATQELIVSIAYNYPAGSILRVRDTRRVFACREFEGAPKLANHRHTFLVLDGQQRLTSLYQAFYGVGDHRYFLNLRKLMEGADFEEAIFHVRATTKWVQARESFELQAKELILPLSILQGGSGRFGQWSRQVARRLSDQQRVLLEDSLDQIEERWIKIIDDYHFPVVTLSEKTSPDALCTIFETLNRTGVKLSAFELLTARFWPEENQSAVSLGPGEDRTSDPRRLRCRSLLRSNGHRTRKPQNAFLQAGRGPQSLRQRYQGLVGPGD